MEMPYFEIQNQYLDKWPLNTCVFVHTFCAMFHGQRKDEDNFPQAARHLITSDNSKKPISSPKTSIIIQK